MSNKVEATYGPYLNIPKNVLDTSAKVLSASMDQDWSTSVEADKDYFRELAREVIQTYIAESIRPTEDSDA